MENLRWILIFAGVAILVLLYLTGRQNTASRRQSDALNRSPKGKPGRDEYVSGYSDSNRPLDDQFADPLMQNQDQYDAAHSQEYSEQRHSQNEYAQQDYTQQGLSHHEITQSRHTPGGYSEQQLAPDRSAQQEFSQSRFIDAQHHEAEFDDDPYARPGGFADRKRAEPPAALQSKTSGGGLSGISAKIEAFGEKLSPRRRARVAATKEGAQKKKESSYDSKIVTIHVVATEGQLLNGAQLLDQFEQRGYHYGDMNIFHSMHEGKTVFSIAKIVVPGSFDIDDVDSFQTPGISLILQLPGPVPADVAFEVLLSEAHDMAHALDAHVLDADRSTLSKQTIQHMREGIYEFMHRQKYFTSATS